MKLLSYLGFYLRIKWSGNLLLPTAKKLGIRGCPNIFKHYTYRVRLVYLNRYNRKRIDSYSYCSSLKYVLKPNFTIIKKRKK